MKSKYKTFIFFAVIFSIISLLLIFYEYMFYRLAWPCIYKIYPKESSSSYAVLFNQGAMQGYTLYFGVIEKKGSDPNLVILGPVQYVDVPFRFMRLVISSDKTVVATESIYEASISFWLAYDFLNSTPYGILQGPSQEEVNNIKARGQIIEKLIQSRGGIGLEFSDSDLSFSRENKLSWLDWKRWQSMVDKAQKKRS